MNLSRNPGDYDYDCLSHAGSKKRERNIPIEAVDHAIESGTPKESKKGRINFEVKWSGATITVVVNPSNNYVVTTYYGTGKTGSALDEAQQRKRDREEKISERSGAAYTGAWK
jgi:hypothetical protein